VKTTLLLVLIVLTSQVSFAQVKDSTAEDESPTGEFIAGAGFVTWQEISLSLGNGFVVAVLDSISEGDVNPSIDVASSGSYFFGYQGYITSRLTIGFHLFYGKYHSTNTFSNKKSVVISNTYIGGMIRSEFIWLQGSLIQLYTAGSLGILPVSSKYGNNVEDKGIEFAFQISPIGIRIGSSLAVFGEFGFGSTGLLAAGVAYRF
jgi:hypothetical protein